MRALRIAFATWSGEPDLTSDDALAQSALAQLGHATTAVPWDRATVHWREYDAVVLRSTWNYHHAFDAFSDWLPSLESAGVLVINPLPLLRWNAHKAYLLHLAAAGIQVPETVLVPRDPAREPLESLQTWPWESAVLKPAVSANAFRTELVRSASPRSLSARVGELAAHGDVLVQQLVPEIEHHGEHSLLFFGSGFSHAVLKRPAAGDFRVQEKFGGTIVAVTPDDDLLDACGRILAALPSRPVYARLDLVRTARGAMLMEVELIEPTLFLATSPGAAERFARAILAHAHERGVA